MDTATGTNPNRLPARDVEWDRVPAGAVTRGQWLWLDGRWVRVAVVAGQSDDRVWFDAGRLDGVTFHLDALVDVCG